MPLTRRTWLSQLAVLTVSSAACVSGRQEKPMGTHAPSNQTLSAFRGGTAGQWRVDRINAVRGDTLPSVAWLHHDELTADEATGDDLWTLRGFTSNARYTTRAEKLELVAVQAGLGRPEATRAALIPIKKSAAWWALAQDERRAIFEDQSRHVSATMKYLPAIARRLHHSRDLGEPFDFLTWFEFAPRDEAAFDQMLAEMRATAEWTYVEREVDVRVTRSSS